MKPIRVRRRRVKGWRLPPNTVCVTRPGRYSNQFRVGDEMSGQPGRKMTADDAVRCFEEAMPDFAKEAIRQELRGKNLACFCALDQPCHADVLLRIANS